MADHDDAAARLPGDAKANAGLSTREIREGRARWGTGRSSRSSDTSTSRQDHPQQAGPRPARSDDSARDSLQREASTRQRGKARSSGGFLLRSSFSGSIRPAVRGPLRELFQTNGKAALRSPATPQSSRSTTNGPSLPPTSHSGGRSSHDETSPSPQSAAGGSEGSAQGRGASSSRGSEEPRTRELSPGFEEEEGGEGGEEGVRDIDSAQIVQMALDLSESRRIASRRHVSRGTPPRLGPSPDGSPGSNLRQHLQQQRKISSSGIPEIQRASPRQPPSSGRLDSPLQAASAGGLESAHDDHYRYQFSSSTLARAQRAKEHLELMAQYRRLLDVLPPLKAGYGPHMAASPSGSPMASKNSRFRRGHVLPLGRQYNPLQYIRNRKVRARERKVIDGEKQGFGDVECVKPWVDRVVDRATSFAANPDDEDDCVLPKFPEADDVDAQVAMDHLSRAATRPRRPRVDWFVEPCDLLADAYWLEQDYNKELVEDRHWRKIFPPAANPSRPASRAAALGIDAIPPFSMQDDDALDTQMSGLAKDDGGASQNSAKDRAKQTLHSIRAFPHRHQGSNVHADLVRHKKDSTSDISGSETTERRSRFKNKSSAQEIRMGANATNIGRDLTEDDMLDMVVKDVRGEEVTDSLKTPDRSPPPLPPLSYSHSSRNGNGSVVETSDSDRRPSVERSALGSPGRHVPGRQSADVPGWSRKVFVGRDSSLPTSPETRSTQGSMEAPVSVRLEPPLSRPGSPIRNPISKIKQIIRDHGSDEPGGNQEDESGSERARHGFSKSSTDVSRGPSRPRGEDGQHQPRQYLDVMPQFRPVRDGNHSPSANANSVDTLRPPRADARSTSTSALVENRHEAVGLDSRQGQGQGQGGSSSGSGSSSVVGDADKRRDLTLVVPRPEGNAGLVSSRDWSMAGKGTRAEETRLTRRETARLRALVLSTGVKAMEISRRARAGQKIFCPDGVGVNGTNHLNAEAMAKKLRFEATKPSESDSDKRHEPYVLAGRSLGAAIRESTRRWEASADVLTEQTVPRLRTRIDEVRSRLADDLSEESRRVSDLADETSRDLALGQPLKVKAVGETIGKMLRRRRRRLRWVRRGVWLMVEWLVVGFMWYVWGVVMVLRAVVGVGRGVVGLGRWMLWL